MSTYTQTYYHIVFATKNREPVLASGNHENLFRYIWGIINNKTCHLYRVNGLADHLHILTSLHPSISLADLVKDVKVSTSKWIKDNAVFPDFSNWQDGYGAFTHSTAEKEALIDYIKNQQEHHKKMSFREELERLLKKAGIEFDEKYLL